MYLIKQQNISGVAYTRLFFVLRTLFAELLFMIDLTGCITVQGVTNWMTSASGTILSFGLSRCALLAHFKLLFS